MTLFGMATKDSAVCIIHACMLEEGDPEGTCTAADGNCGDTLTSKIFFAIYDFTLMVTCVPFMLPRRCRRLPSFFAVTGWLAGRPPPFALCRCGWPHHTAEDESSSVAVMRARTGLSRCS